LIVEFTGPVGSGKTTTRNAVLERLEGEGLPVSTDPYIKGAERTAPQRWMGAGIRRDLVSMPAFFSFLARYPGFCSWLGWQASFGEGAVGFRMAVARSVIRKIADFERALNCEREIILVDEGLFHAAHNVLIGPWGNAVDKQLHRFAARVPLPDVLVGMHADKTTMRSRLRSRGDLSPRMHAPGAFDGMVDHAHEGFNQLYPEVARRIEWESKLFIRSSSKSGEIDAIAEMIGRRWEARNQC
jgi:hypothetical protein